MSQPPPVLPYVQQRICGRTVVTGSGGSLKIVVRQNWRLCIALALLGLVCAAGGWLVWRASGPRYEVWAGFTLFCGYAAAIIAWANAIGQAVTVQRAKLSARRLTYSRGRHSEAFLRDEIVSIASGDVRTQLGRQVPSVHVFLRSGAVAAILLTSRKETEFAAAALREAMDLASDPLHLADFEEVSTRGVCVRVAASGAIGELRRFPAKSEGLIVSFVVAFTAGLPVLVLSGYWPALSTAAVALVIGYCLWDLFVRLSPSISGGVWDGELLFYERRWLRRRAELRFALDDVATVEVSPAPNPNKSVLCIVLSNGTVVHSEKAWPAAKLQVLADTINAARRLCH